MIFKITNLKAVNFRKISILFIFIFAFVGFYHGDFIHTVINSTFWSNNLYEVCEGCHYFPLIYWLFYLWSIPIQLISSRSFSDPQAYIIGLETDPLFFLYNKFLLIILFFASTYLIFIIAKILKIDQPKLPALIFALSPFTFFSIFIYSGYDIFSVFFSLLGIFLFLKKRIFYSFIIFSISLSFKLFSIVIALSLLALLKDKFIKKFGIGLLLLSFLAFQIILFYDEPNFIDEITYLLRRHSVNNSIPFSPSLIVAIGFFIWLLLLNFSSRVKIFFNGKNFILVPYISILFLYCYSPIAPPWTILCLPYVYLFVVKIKHEKLFLLFEIFFFVIFCIMVSNIWSRNIDLSIGNYGPYNFLHNPSYLYKNIYIDLGNNHLLFFLGFCSLYLFFLIPIVLTFFRNSYKFFKWNLSKIIYLRFTFTAVFFLLPFIISPFLKQDNDFLNNLNSDRMYVYSYYRNDLYTLNPNSYICELAQVPFSGLEYISMRIPFDYNTKYADIQFNIFHKKNYMIISQTYFDNKSLFLKIPETISDNTEPIQFCIYNNSDSDLNFFVNNNNTEIKSIKGYKTFVEKNMPFYFYFTKP
jgi:hypothetical protein